jgi:hypothetical protein
MHIDEEALASNMFILSSITRSLLRKGALVMVIDKENRELDHETGVGILFLFVSPEVKRNYRLSSQWRLYVTTWLVPLLVLLHGFRTQLSAMTKD